MDEELGQEEVGVEAQFIKHHLRDPKS